MNYSLFEIEDQIEKLTDNLTDEEMMGIFTGKPNFNYLIEIDLLMQNVLNKKLHCKNLFKMQEEKYSQSTIAFADTAFLLEYLTETENYLSKIKTKIVDNENDKHYLFVLEKLVNYFLSVFKEIYVMLSNNCFLGATGRYRIFLEIYCIFKYFNKYPDSISRYVDHFVIKDYLMRKKFYPGAIRPKDKENYQIVHKRHKSEYSTFKQNYGWACQKLKNPQSIKEIIRLALDDIEYSFITSEYNLVSEFSHASLNIAMLQHINKSELLKILIKSCDLGITIMRIYIGWIIQISEKEDKRLLALSDFLGRLAKSIRTPLTSA
jgi:hypothetical protein